VRIRGVGRVESLLRRGGDGDRSGFQGETMFGRLITTLLLLAVMSVSCSSSGAVEEPTTTVSPPVSEITGDRAAVVAALRAADSEGVWAETSDRDVLLAATTVCSVAQSVAASELLDADPERFVDSLDLSFSMIEGHPELDLVVTGANPDTRGRLGVLLAVLAADTACEPEARALIAEAASFTEAIGSTGSPAVGEPTEAGALTFVSDPASMPAIRGRFGPVSWAPLVALQARVDGDCAAVSFESDELKEYAADLGDQFVPWTMFLRWVDGKWEPVAVTGVPDAISDVNDASDVCVG
jgi:hypothetical protein